jgi:hypothetical protein
MWQDEQPPARNIVWPLPRSGVCAGSVAAAIVSGAVRIQNAAAANPDATTAAMTN